MVFIAVEHHSATRIEPILYPKKNSHHQSLYAWRKVAERIVESSLHQTEWVIKDSNRSGYYL